MKYGLLPLLLLLFSSASIADYYLYTFDLNQRTEAEDYIPLKVERFISLSDCRKRGLKDKLIIDSLGGRGGFACAVSD